MDSSVSLEDRIWFLRVCHHVPFSLYYRIWCSALVVWSWVTVCDPAPHNHSQHNQCRTPYAAVHSLVLLTMGMMMPETCWDRHLTLNIRLVASCWFLSLHPTFMIQGHKSLKFPKLSPIRNLEQAVTYKETWPTKPSNSAPVLQYVSGLSMTWLPTCYTSTLSVFVTDNFTVHYSQRCMRHLQYQW